MAAELELIVDRERDRAEERSGDGLALRSPEVGFFSRALPAGALLWPGAKAGILHALGRHFELSVPAGASGRVLNAPPELVLAPVGYGTCLYEVAPLATGEPAPRASARDTKESASGLVFRAPHSGRFWQRSSPKDPPFVHEGELLADGQSIGLIEVMKTFTQLVYRATGDLPPRARLLRFAVQDGGEVKSGDPLLQLEPA